MNTRPAFVRLGFMAVTAVIVFVSPLPAQEAPIPPPPAKRLPPAGIVIPDAARAELTTGAAALRTEIDAAARELAAKNSALLALLPDAEVYYKAVDWALRYDEFFDAKQIAVARKALTTGRERAAQLRAGKASWLDATGLIVRGYRSKIDGSVQPYGLVVPATLPRNQPRRLLVWLLGRSEKRTELAFLAEREAGPAQLTPRDTITLVPYGRFCNATKFAGEVDVFEAMSAVRMQYTIDANRMTVAGFSMGGASVWHLATHHAGLWCAASPGAGFAETAIYNQALAPGKPPRTPWEQTLWHWYNATDYAGNLFNVPLVAYSGEIDPQKQSADLMEEAAAKEGLKLERLIGPKTAHKYEPETKKVLTARLEALADKGRDPMPKEVRLTTYTTRYPGESWVRIVGLGQHWQRADVRARLSDDGKSVVADTKNVSALSFDRLKAATSLTIDGQKLALAARGHSDDPLFVAHQSGKWSVIASAAEPTTLRKGHGLSGPIDDAFLDAFIFARPTSQPFNEKIGSWTKTELARAEKMWRDLFRGVAPTIDDTAISDKDIRTKNLVLWGDPASNKILARIIDQLPLKWNAQQIRFRGQTYDATSHAPILIFPNPLNPRRYVVLNSGIDFRDEAYGTNSLQTPKLPDYAIIDLREAPGPRWPGKVVDAGFFDETWKIQL